MNAMLDKPLKVTKRTVRLGEWINDMPKGKRRETYESEYGYWILVKARNERKKHGATNEQAFRDALQLSLRRRRCTEKYRCFMAGLYHWWKYIHLPRRYKPIWSLIRKIQKQIDKANKARQ